MLTNTTFFSLKLPIIHSHAKTIFMTTLCIDSDSTAVENMKEDLVVQEGYVFEEEIHLTVLKTSLFFAGDGFTVYDSKGEVIFRVESYGPDSRDLDELVLMDPDGRCILTVRRKVRTPPWLFLLNPVNSLSQL